MTALVILAAGVSSRLGRPKQELRFQGRTLLQHGVDTGLQTTFEPVLLVTGAYRPAPVEGLRVVHNPDWQQGMASSIQLAVKTLETEEEIQAVLFMVCDQPFVTSELLDRLRQTR